MMPLTPQNPELFMAEMLVLSSTLILHLLPSFSKFMWTPKQSMGAALALSLLSMFVLMMENLTTTSYTIYSSTPLHINFNIKTSMNSLIFSSVALYITRAILEYTEWYMAEEHEHQKFSSLLLLFLMTMLIFISANDLLLLFIGWETMGMMSFMLISWWHGRVDAPLSGLQAIMYNRTADIGLFLFMAWSIMNLSTLNLDIIIQQNAIKATPPMVAMGIMLTAMGKSAQFGFHPWLPAAMEGPTPVSALLHSSTMVTAGVFLLIRLFPLLTPSILTACLIIGALTSLFASVRALMQNDIKKIIAFSTLSQLGLMVATVGLQQPDLAFLHICTHAFFKANMFLAAGVITHMLYGEQDIRKMGGLKKTMPTTAHAMIVSTLALAGFPYLSAFFSKETIMKMAMTSHTNSICLAMLMASIMFTTIYSLRMVNLILTNNPWYCHLPLFNEHPTCQNVLSKLTTMSITVGLFLAYLMPAPNPSPPTITSTMILFTLMVTILIAVISIPIIQYTKSLPLPPDTFMKHMMTLSEDSNGPLHRMVSEENLKIGQLKAIQIMDQHWKEKAGPKYIEGCFIPPILHTTFNEGLIKPYLFSFIFLLLIYLLLTLS